MTEKNRPFISFVVFAYNQQKFIRDAVEGALSQEYAPMEIILSDDCSTDETFSIMQEMASRYSGTHEVIVRRNEFNLGFIRHVNEVFEAARGEWVVVAAGDDISMPNRVAEIAKVVDEYPDINMVSSALMPMEENGKKKDVACLFQGQEEPMDREVIVTGAKEFLDDNAPYVHGATLAYSKKLIQAFPPMPPDAVYEDELYKFRSIFLGNRAHVNKPLVCYRNHFHQTTNVSGKISRDLYIKNRRLATGKYVVLRQALDDLRGIDLDYFMSARYLQRYLKSEFELCRDQYRLFLFRWPIRLFYFLFVLVSSPEAIRRMRRSQICLSIFPVTFMKALYDCLSKYKKGHANDMDD
ncbi:glycosyltransferase [Marinobacter sp. chi1]|uniref:Glycosyltransferase n=1 Tax=Marinobacter suaedae TaxID=3057675 RepID=A0ABT8VWH0_9GAMM|nr:glycosyltransferase [Marinobacter sp. chi1]MDO3720324.1 glycosyltransferase [Marinobacter sp. chi1]